MSVTILAIVVAIALVASALIAAPIIAFAGCVLIALFMSIIQSLFSRK